MERALLSDAANLSCNYFSAEHEVRPVIIQHRR